MLQPCTRISFRLNLLNQNKLPPPVCMCPVNCAVFDAVSKLEKHQGSRLFGTKWLVVLDHLSNFPQPHAARSLKRRSPTLLSCVTLQCRHIKRHKLFPISRQKASRIFKNANWVPCSHHVDDSQTSLCIPRFKWPHSCDFSSRSPSSRSSFSEHHFRTQTYSHENSSTHNS